MGKKLDRVWWYLTKWIAPVGPVIIYSKDSLARDGHHYRLYGMALAIRRKT